METENYLRSNEYGLYDLTIKDKGGAIIVDVKNITFKRAVSIMEENSYGKVHYNDGD